MAKTVIRKFLYFAIVDVHLDRFDFVKIVPSAPQFKESGGNRCQGEHCPVDESLFLNNRIKKTID